MVAGLYKAHFFRTKGGRQELGKVNKMTNKRIKIGLDGFKLWKVNLKNHPPTFSPGGVKATPDVDRLAGHLWLEVTNLQDLLHVLGLGHVHLLDTVPEERNPWILHTLTQNCCRKCENLPTQIVRIKKLKHILVLFYIVVKKHRGGNWKGTWRPRYRSSFKKKSKKTKKETYLHTVATRE